MACSMGDLVLLLMGGSEHCRRQSWAVLVQWCSGELF